MRLAVKIGKIKIGKLKTGGMLSRSVGGNIILFTLLALLGAFMVLPLIFVINNAFKPINEILRFPPRFFVRNPTLKNFTDLHYLLSETWVPLSRYLFNTIFITVIGSASTIYLGSCRC